MVGLNKIGRAFKSLKWYEIVMCIVMFGIAVYYALQPQSDTPQWLAIINFIFGPVTVFHIGTFPVMLLDLIMIPMIIGAAAEVCRMAFTLFFRLKKEGR